MERTNRQTCTFSFWHVAGLLLLLCAAVGIWFGVHPRYRFLAVGIVALAALAAWKRSWMPWIVIAVQCGLIVFLWTFPQAGYRIVSLIPLAIIGMLLIFRFCKKPLKIAASIVLALLVLGVSAIEIPIVASAIQPPAQDADYVVVLGAAVYGDKPSITLEHRLMGALGYLAENPKAKAVVSGGQGEGEDISEAECMRRYLVENGVGPDRILLENRSTSTKENLAFSKAVIEADGGSVENVAIVSSGYHLYRAKQTAAALGIRASGVPGADGYPIYVLGMYLREAAAVAKMWVFGV